MIKINLKFVMIKIIFLFILLCFFAINSPAKACDPSLYNYLFFYESSYFKEPFSYYAIWDSVEKFCRASGPILRASNALNSKIILTPILFENTNIVLDDNQKNIFADSIENQLNSNYNMFSAQTISSKNKSIKKILDDYQKEFSLTNEAQVLKNNDILKKLYEKHNILAILNISVYKLNSKIKYGFDLNGVKQFFNDDLSVVYCSEAKIRYRLTNCKTGEVIWIDEMPGYIETTSYVTFFENGLLFNVNHSNTIGSVLAEIK